MTCQRMFGKELEPDETVFWAKFLGQYSLAEIKYAFELWNANGRWFPKPKDISDLCEAYRVTEVNKEFPIGCERCDWTGFYQVRMNGVERVVAECPCRTNVQLRTKRTGPLATRSELADMFRQLNALGKDKVIEKPKNSGAVPTSRELAEKLQKHREVLAKAGRNE